mmetsp:Transcript_99237/g.179222  ORF Transcript_99237/g.179222 Transcript_99237/m.179222 type:complete len:97 (-) Transcript_99237:59-349(-)
MLRCIECKSSKQKQANYKTNKQSKQASKNKRQRENRNKQDKITHPDNKLASSHLSAQQHNTVLLLAMSTQPISSTLGNKTKCHDHLLISSRKGIGK